MSLCFDPWVFFLSFRTKGVHFTWGSFEVARRSVDSSLGGSHATEHYECANPIKYLLSPETDARVRRGTCFSDGLPFLAAQRLFELITLALLFEDLPFQLGDLQVHLVAHGLEDRTLDPGPGTGVRDRVLGEVETGPNTRRVNETKQSTKQQK